MEMTTFDIDNNPGTQNDGVGTPFDTGGPSASPAMSPVSEGEVFRSGANDTVVIADPSPIVILFGSGASGKTMTLIRIARYLSQCGYRVRPERTFRDARDKHYQEMCDNFVHMVNNNKAPGRNQVIDFMLVKVMDPTGRPICQLLEAPGEHYFDPQYPTRPFPTYLNTISQAPNRRTWLFIVEIDWINQSDRNNFANKICGLQQQYVYPNDKVIFTCHKADKHPQLMSGGTYNTQLYFNEIRNQYPGIFQRYENRNPITRLWRRYNFDFVVFSAGSFTDDGEGGMFYVPSNESNPARLWRAIMKTVRGGF